MEDSLELQPEPRSGSWFPARLSSSWDQREPKSYTGVSLVTLSHFGFQWGKGPTSHPTYQFEFLKARENIQWLMLQSSKKCVRNRDKGRKGEQKESERVTERQVGSSRRQGWGGMCSCQGLSSFSAELFMAFDCLVFDYIYWILWRATTDVQRNRDKQTSLYCWHTNGRMRYITALSYQLYKREHYLMR